MVVVEDDMSVRGKGWDISWRAATLQFGHVNFLNNKEANKRRDRMISGSGVLDDPFIAKFATGHCMAMSRSCVEAVGYLNPLFVGYGFAHIDYSQRCGRAGFGMKAGGYVHLNTGLELLGIPPTADKSRVEQNRELSAALRDKDIYVAPYADEEQKLILEAEVSRISFTN